MWTSFSEHTTIHRTFDVVHKRLEYTVMYVNKMSYMSICGFLVISRNMFTYLILLIEGDHETLDNFLKLHHFKTDVAVVFICKIKCFICLSSVHLFQSYHFLFHLTHNDVWLRLTTIFNTRHFTISYSRQYTPDIIKYDWRTSENK